MDLRDGWSSAVLMAFAVVAASFGGCEATLEEDCTAGPCGGATVAAASTIAAVTSGGEGGGAAGCGFSETGELPCDVFTILDARCHKCHQDPPVNGAPFSLLTWQSFQEVYGGKQIWERADVAIEPGAIPQMPFLEEPLPEEQRAVLHAWFATCAAGECAKAPLPGQGGGGQGGAGSGGRGGSGGTGGS